MILENVSSGESFVILIHELYSAFLLKHRK